MASKSKEIDLIALPELIERISLSKATIYRKLAEQPPSFPAPLKIGAQRVAWRVSDIARWLDEAKPTAPRAA